MPSLFICQDDYIPVGTIVVLTIEYVVYNSRTQTHTDKRMTYWIQPQGVLHVLVHTTDKLEGNVSVHMLSECSHHCVIR